MRLRRAEAVRYGRLEGGSLGDLGDGLTVVLGPNEAGKSTYTSLVRHVLYGYPTQREREAGYFASGGGRLARLVFDEAGESWVVERAEGPRGGEVTVRSLSGAERPGLLGEITGGVSALAYRVVFGFGLDEMAGIEELRGSQDDIIARLYAAGAGLRVSPHEVKAAIEREAGEIYKPAGRKQQVNTLAAELRQVRGEIGTLRQEAEAFTAERERLGMLQERLHEAHSARDEARRRATALVLAAQKAEERLQTIRTQEEALLGLRRERKERAGALEAITVDEALLAAAPEIDAVLEDAAGFAQLARSVADAEAAVAKARVRADEALANTGFSAETLEGLGDIGADAGEADEVREDLQRLQMQLETRTESAAHEAATLEQARVAARRALETAGITPDPAAVPERLAALDALEALRAGAGGHTAARGDGPALVLLVSGIAAVVAGAILTEWLTVGIGVALTLAGVWFLLRARRSRPSSAGHEREYLATLGLAPDAGALEISRARRALDAARAAIAVEAEAVTSLEAAERDVVLARDALATRQTAWGAWLARHGLDPAVSPAVATRTLGLVKDARTAAAGLAEAETEAARLAGQLDALAIRIREAARPFVPVPSVYGRGEATALANRLRDTLAASRAAVVARAEAARALADADARIADEEHRAARAAADLREVLERFDLAEQGTHDDLQVMRAHAESEAAEAEAAFDALVAEKNQLEGRLENESRERRIGELHLAEAGLRERLADAVERYVVLAAAARLLGEAQARYERERQPEVVKRAGELFATMTGGRYTGLTIPIGEGRIEVFDARAGARTSDLLSRGTAEQLYLALRLGLIAQLGVAGPGLPVLMDDVLVNFDPERRQGAAEAVVELAEARQVVFFTCHPETAELFGSIAPSHTRLELGRCDL